MVRIRKLNELMDNPVPYETKFISDTQGQWDFEVDNIEYTVEVIKAEPLGFYLPNFNDLIYKELLQPKGKEFVIPEMMVGWIQGNYAEIMFGGSTRSGDAKNFGITGTGNQFTVFSTVIEIIKEEIIPMDISPLLAFTAKESSRQKLYKILSREVGKKVAEYRYIGSTDNMRGTETYFFIKPQEFIDSLEKMGIII